MAVRFSFESGSVAFGMFCNGAEPADVFSAYFDLPCGLDNTARVSEYGPRFVGDDRCALDARRLVALGAARRTRITGCVVVPANLLRTIKRVEERALYRRSDMALLKWFGRRVPVTTVGRSAGQILEKALESARELVESGKAGVYVVHVSGLYVGALVGAIIRAERPNGERVVLMPAGMFFLQPGSRDGIVFHYGLQLVLKSALLEQMRNVFGEVYERFRTAFSLVAQEVSSGVVSAAFSGRVTEEGRVSDYLRITRCFADLPGGVEEDVSFVALTGAQRKDVYSVLDR